MQARARHSRTFRSANATMEMAIVFPVLIYLGLGLAEFGQFFYVKNAFEDAARDVARISSNANAVSTDPATTATSTLGFANITFNSSWMTITDVTVNSTVTNVASIPAGDAFKVVIQVPYNQIPSAYRPLFNMTGKGIGNSKMVVGQCTVVKL